MTINFVVSDLFWETFSLKMRTVHQKTLKGILCIVVIFLFVYVAEYEVLKYHIQESALASEPTELSKPWVSSSTTVRFWIDMPNKFPWRHCLQDYNGVLTTLDCERVGIYLIYMTYCNYNFRREKLKSLKLYQ